MLPQVRVEPRASNFYALHATVCANFLFPGSLRLLDPHMIMLYSSFFIFGFRFHRFYGITRELNKSSSRGPYHQFQVTFMHGQQLCVVT